MRCCWIWGLVGVLLLAPASALAQSEPDVAKAREQYEEGKTAYRLGKFEEAIAAWQQAYELKRDPIFLYNIAQAYREAKNYDKAVFFYRSYLNETQNPMDREVVEQRITEMETLRELERERRTQSEPIAAEPEVSDGPPVATTPATGTPPAAAATEGGRGLKVAGLASGGAGVALIATGAWFGMSSQSDQDDVQAAIDRGGPWTEALQDQEDSGRRKATLANVTMGIGAAAMIGGGVLYYLGVRSDRLEVTPAAPDGSAGATITLRY